jgi:hypothetical protein
VTSAFGFGPTVLTNRIVIEVGAAATVVFTFGLVADSVLSAACTGELQSAPTSPAATKARDQRRIGEAAARRFCRPEGWWARFTMFST